MNPYTVLRIAETLRSVRLGFVHNGHLHGGEGAE